MNIFRNKLWTALLLSALTLPAAAQMPGNGEEGFATTDKAGYERYRREVGHQSNYLLNALTAEIRLQEGDAQAAFSHYLGVYRRSKDPAAAERMMDILLDNGELAIARQIMREWAANEAEVSPEQRYMRWLMAARSGDLATVSSGLADALAQTSPQRLRNVFLNLAELVKEYPKAASPENTDLIHEAAARYPRMAEAAVADTLFSAHQGRVEDARNAFARLTALVVDEENYRLPSGSLELVAELLHRRNPAVWRHFFNEAAAARLPPALRYYYASVLLEEGRTQQAYALLRSAFRTGVEPESPYMRGQLEQALQEDRRALNHYRESLYRSSSDEEEKRELAKLYILYAFNENDGDAVKIWAGRIDRLLVRHAVLARWAALTNDTASAAYHFRALEQAVGQAGFTEAVNWGANVDAESVKHLTAAQSAAYVGTVSEHYRRLSARDRTMRRNAGFMRQRMAIALFEQHPEHRSTALAQLQSLLQEVPADERASLSNTVGYLMSNFPGSDLNEAERLIRIALAEDEAEPAYLDSLGWVLFKQGRAQEALPYLQKAFAALPIAEIAAHLGEVLWSLNRRDEARQIWAAVPAAARSDGTYTDTLQRLGVSLD